MIRVLICDDHTIVRQGLKQIVDDCDDIVVAGEAGSGEKVLRMIEKDNYDVIVLDIEMDGLGGLETLKEINHKSPGLSVLMLSMHPEQQYSIRVLKAGAAGYLTKKSAPEELILAIRAVAAGKKYLTDSVSQQLASSLSDNGAKLPHEKLSDREYQVFVQLAKGKSINEIAKQMYLSAKTISTYKARVLEKAGFENVSNLIRYALEHNLAP